MSLETDVRYLLDRFEIQDKIALYGLGQDLHQPDSGDNDILVQWGELFAPEAEIDCTDVGLPVFSLQAYAELMRGPGLRGGGLDAPFNVWQHIEGHATVTVEGDKATSIAPHLHTHGVRETEANTFAVGYWHDRWERCPEGWRIVQRRLQQLYFHTFPLTQTPNLFEIKFISSPTNNKKFNSLQGVYFRAHRILSQAASRRRSNVRRSPMCGRPICHPPAFILAFRPLLLGQP